MTALLCFIAAILYLTYAFFHVSTSFAPDFSVLYFATKNLLHHANPYTNTNLYTFFAYPPVTTLLYIPFTIVPYSSAQVFFMILSVISIFGSVHTALRIICGKYAVNQFCITATLFIFSFPTKYTLGMGQSNIIALWLLLLGYRYRRSRHWISVLCTAGAVMLKPVLGFVLVFYLVRRKTHIIVPVLIIMSICLMLSIIIYGVGVYTYYVQHVIPELMTVAGREVYYNQGILGFVSRISADAATRRVVAALVSLGLLFSLVIILRKKVSDDGYLGLLLTALVMIDTLSWQHHFVFLLFPLVYYFIRFDDRDEHTALSILSYLAYILVALNIRSPALVSGPLSPLILSHQFLGALIFYLLLYAKFYRSGETAEISR